MIIDHDHYKYRRKWRRIGGGKYNGAFYYSKEIVKYFIPAIETDRNWITVNAGIGADHSIVFVHNNLHPEHYDFLKPYDDLILVCGLEETVDKVKHLGKAIYLPLSVDVEYVKQFQRKKTKDAAFAGRPNKKNLGKLPPGIDYLQGMKRQKLLPLMSQYRTVFCVGRTAIEAKILDCEIGIYDNRFPTDRWEILDSRDAAKMLAKEL